MGELANRMNRDEVEKTAQQLSGINRQVRELGGQITNLAAGYKAIRATAVDADDTAALDGRLATAIAGLKTDMDALDVDTRAIVDQVIDGVFGARA